MSTPVFRLPNSEDHGLRAINIQLWGFKDCHVANAGGVAQVLSLLPAQLLEGLRNIYFEPVPMVPGLTRWIRVSGRTGLQGRYDRKSASILLHANKSRYELFQALFHELGHFVYFRILSSEQKKRWVTEIYKAEAPVSRYGARNAAEDFAEAFSLYLIEPQAGQRWPRKYGFLREVVFRSADLDYQGIAKILARDREQDIVPGFDVYV